VGMAADLKQGLPSSFFLSRRHLMCCVQNNHYFVKDTSSNGTYVRIGVNGQGERVELRAGDKFAVGRAWFMVMAINGNAAVNQAALLKRAEAGPAAPAAAEEELGSDEEYADSDDDLNSRVKLDGEATLVIAPLDKTLRKELRTTSFQAGGCIGTGTSGNRLVIKCDRKPSKYIHMAIASVSATHSRIVLEGGRFFLEDAGSAFGTYMGLRPKTPFEINAGDELMLGACRFRVRTIPLLISPIDGRFSGGDTVAATPLTAVPASLRSLASKAATAHACACARLLLLSGPLQRVCGPPFEG